MKKLFAVVLAVLMVFTLAACSTNEGSATEETGKVYYLNFKPESDEAWQKLAADYTAETGVEVKVVTAASGTYDTTLQNEMGKSGAPTMFQVGNAGAVSTYGDYCYDLTGTDVYNEMTTHAFDQVGDGITYSIGYCYECFGIIVNKALLTQAGHDISEITNFESLKAVAEDIHARANELGFDAFTNSGLDGSSSWRFTGHLATVPLYYEGVNKKMEIKGTYLDEFKNIWDLYINNSAIDKVANNTATGDDAEAAFGTGKAVFYQNGSWEYDALTSNYGMNADDLQMIPLYCGHDGEEKAGLASGTENCWAVNNTSSEADIKATLDFMKWVVTSDKGTTMLAEQFGPCPFKSAKEPKNVFFAQANALLAAGNYNMDWSFNYTPAVDDFRAGLVTALQSYAQDGNWDTVVNAFVNGWNTLLASEAE